MSLDSNLSVYNMLRYSGTDRIIPTLGTLRSCLPLFLAGAAVGLDKMTLELGPYFGLSSKCIAAGMKTNGIREKSFIAFDTFSRINNYLSIKNNVQHSWIFQEYPEFNEKSNTSFLFLWKKGVQPVYPTAEGRAGSISAETLNVQTIGKATQDIDLISIDSAKSVKGLQNQLAGMRPLKVGTILFLLDFEFDIAQVQ